jgi:hypothetical protein
VGVRSFLPEHEVCTISEMGWPEQLDNGELLKMAERSGFDVMITADQNTRFQQNLANRKLSLLVLGSNIWPVVREHEAAIRALLETAGPGFCMFLDMTHANRQRK